MLKEGQRILADEEKARQQKIASEKFQNQRDWGHLFEAAKSALPIEVASYLVLPPGFKDGQQCIPQQVHNFYDWHLKIGGLVPITVNFDQYNKVESYMVALAEPTFHGFSRQLDQQFAGPKALERALAFAAQQSEILHTRQVEHERQEKEYQEKETLASKELKYQDIDGSEPVPDAVLINGLRMLIRQELQKQSA